MLEQQPSVNANNTTEKLYTLAFLMSTLPSVPLPRKHEVQADVQVADPKPENVKLNNSPEIIDGRELPSSNRQRSTHVKLLTSQDLSKITNKPEPEDITMSAADLEGKTASRHSESPTDELMKTSGQLTPMQRKPDRIPTSAGLLSPLMSTTIPEIPERSTKPFIGDDSTSSDLMQLKIEQERTKQMQLKCELSRSVADLLNRAEDKGETADLIRRLFFEEFLETSEYIRHGLHSQSAPTSTSPTIRNRSSHHYTNIVIPEPHLAPSPVRIDNLSAPRKSVCPLVKVKHEQGYSYKLKPKEDEKKIQLVSKDPQENADETLETNHHSPMSDVDRTQATALNSGANSMSGSRPPSIGGSSRSSLLSDHASGIASLMTPIVHSAPMTRKHLRETLGQEDTRREPSGGHPQATPTGVASAVYPVYYAQPNYGYSPEHQRYYVAHDVRPTAVTMQDDKQANGQVKLQRSQMISNLPIRVQTPHGHDHQRKHQIHQQQSVQRGPQIGHENRSTLVYTGPLQTGQGSDNNDSTIENNGTHTQQRTPQHSPQQGQPLYYVNHAPVTIPENTGYAPSHYFIPPPLQPGMVSWVPTSVVPEMRREEEELHINKKRRSLKSGISFMISTPQNPPARKYNKLQ